MSKRFTALLLLAWFVSGPAMADQAARNPDSPHKIICKRVKQTGTHFKQRTCKTRQEWTEMSARSEDDMRNMNDLEAPGVPFTPPPDAG